MTSKDPGGRVLLAEQQPASALLHSVLAHTVQAFPEALAEVGLPQADIPLALLMFNVGVEAGQLLFIAGVIIIIHAWKYMTRLELTWLPKATVYAIGSTASFWVIERTMSF